MGKQIKNKFITVFVFFNNLQINSFWGEKNLPFPLWCIDSIIAPWVPARRRDVDGAEVEHSCKKKNPKKKINFLKRLVKMGRRRQSRILVQCQRNTRIKSKSTSRLIYKEVNKHLVRSRSKPVYKRCNISSSSTATKWLTRRKIPS